MVPCHPGGRRDPPLRLLGVSSWLVRRRRDVPPTGQSLFFASPKKRNQKKGDPTVAVRLRRTALRCSVFGASRQTRFVHFVHAAQTNVAKSVVDARYRARPQTPALLDATHGGPEHQIRLASHRLDDASLRSRRCEARRGEVAKQRPNCSWAPWVASRSAGVWGRVRSTLRNLTSRRLSERSGRRPRSEFGAGPKARAPQSSRPMADRHRRVAFLLVPFLWRSKEKGLGCRDDIPTRPHAVNKTHKKANQGFNTSARTDERTP